MFEIWIQHILRTLQWELAFNQFNYINENTVVKFQTNKWIKYKWLLELVNNRFELI